MSFARLTYAPTEKNADAFYIAGINVADAFIGLEFGGKFYAVTRSLELGNFKKHSRVSRVFSYEALKKELGISASLGGILARVLEKIGASGIEVGQDFSVGLFQELRRNVRARIAKGALFPERIIKSVAEQTEIRKANSILAEGFALVAETLRSAQIRKGKLFWKSQALTSELLRKRLQLFFFEKGLLPPSDLIVAGGAQACDPHCSGFGPLKPRELIVVDLFAPLQKTHLWGDMTRTFIKGTPSPAQAALVEAVAAAQKWAIRSLKPGARGQKIHAGVESLFEAEGYHTRRRAKGYEGFFHGTGHALGLECHDNSGFDNGLSTRPKPPLRVGEVLTVEPGLYYREIGGCRIEDNGVVTQEGFRLLSKAPYEWVL